MGRSRRSRARNVRGTVPPNRKPNYYPGGYIAAPEDVNRRAESIDATHFTWQELALSGDVGAAAMKFKVTAGLTTYEAARKAVEEFRRQRSADAKLEVG